MSWPTQNEDNGPVGLSARVPAEVEWYAPVSAGWISCFAVAAPPYIIGFQRRFILRQCALAMAFETENTEEGIVVQLRAVMTRAEYLTS